MLTATALVLLGTAATVALVHTLVGVDHTLPFIVLARSRGWSLPQTLAVTAACGVAHVLASLLLGAMGAAFGLSLGRLQIFESTRGTLAACLLVGFGLLYSAHALRKHQTASHSHAALPMDANNSSVFWSLFLVFVLGPCEPLLPLLAAPALADKPILLALVVLVFASVTLATMLTVVTLAVVGFRHIHLHRFELYANAFAGAAIALSGLLVLAFGI